MTDVACRPCRLHPACQHSDTVGSDGPIAPYGQTALWDTDPDVADAGVGDLLTDLPKEVGQFRYRTVLADPPWRFVNRTGKVGPEHRRLWRYDTLSIAELCTVPVQRISRAPSHLYMWVPNALLPQGLQVMQAWGYEYKTNIVWAKRRHDGHPDGRGMGFYFRGVTELVLFGVMGHMRTRSAGRKQVNMIETVKREHSRKPDELYDVIEQCSPPPYVELFARHVRPGWEQWGKDAPANGVTDDWEHHQSSQEDMSSTTARAELF